MKKIMILFAFAGLGITYANAQTTSTASHKCDSTTKAACCAKKGEKAECKDKKAKGKKKKACCAPQSSATKMQVNQFAKTEEVVNSLPF